MNTFPPKPGTVAYLVIAFLEAKLPARPRATVGAIAGELRGVTPSQVRDALEAAHTAGYVNREYEAGPGGRGPVFYELVRNTLGELAVGGAEPRAQAAAALAEAADDGWLTGTGAPPHPGGVIEPVSPRVSAARDAMLEALRAYGQTMDPIELVAAIAQTLGQMVALLDQRVHTVDAVMDLVLENIAAGNGAMIEQQLGNPRGNA